MDEAEFRAEIEGLGLVANVETGNAATRAGDVGLVYAVNPTGNLSEGQEVTGTIYGQLGEPPAPQPVTEGASNSETVPRTVTISWPRYDRCPEDLPLSGYTFSVQGGTPLTGNPVGPNVTEMNIEITEAGETTITYIANCSQQESAASGSTVITSEAPAEEEPPPAEEEGEGDEILP